MPKTFPTPLDDDADDDGMPEDPDAFRCELARRIATFCETWRDCPRTDCRRMKRCLGEPPVCLGPLCTEEEGAIVLRDVSRALKERLGK